MENRVNPSISLNFSNGTITLTGYGENNQLVIVRHLVGAGPSPDDELWLGGGPIVERGPPPSPPRSATPARS